MFPQQCFTTIAETQGAFGQQQSSGPPRSLLTTRVASASPSTSSEMMTRGLLRLDPDSSSRTIAEGRTKSFFLCAAG